MHFKKIQFVTNCCVLHLTVIWANDLKAKRKRKWVQKRWNLPIFQQGGSRYKHHGRGDRGSAPRNVKRCTSPVTLLSSHSKHTPHSDLRLSDKAKCSYLPPPRNIRYTSSKRCKIARKVIDEQRKRKSSANLLLISRKSWIEEKEIDEVRAPFYIFFKSIHFMFAVRFAKLHFMSELLSCLL